MKRSITLLTCLVLFLLSGVFMSKKNPPSDLDKKLDSLLDANGFDGTMQDQLKVKLGRKVNKNKAELGNLVFFDPGLGLHQDNSCSGCHSPTAGFGDSQPIAVGIQNNDTVGPHRSGPHNQRRSPSVVNTVFYPKLMWNGRFSAVSGDPFDNSMGYEFPAPEGDLFNVSSDYVSQVKHLLVAQAHIPFTELTEMAGFTTSHYEDLVISTNCSTIDYNIFNDGLGFTIPPFDINTGSPNFGIRDSVLMLLNSNEKYKELFGAIYPQVSSGADIDFAMVGEVIAEFEFGLTAANSPLDKFAKGNNNAMTEEEKRGAVVFFTIGKCVSCHSVSGNSNQMFSDFEMHNAGVPEVHPVFGVGTGNVAFSDLSCVKSVTGTLDIGREEFTGDIADRYKFRSSPLRNLKAQVAFFHNGSFNNLEDAINYHLNPSSNVETYVPSQFGVPSDFAYNSSDMADVMLTLDPVLAEGINLTEDEKSDLIAFLTDGLYDKRVSQKQAKKLVPAEVPSGKQLPYFEFGVSGPQKVVANGNVVVEATEIKLYPNPVVSDIYIEAMGIINVEVVDATGKIMINQQVNPKEQILNVAMNQLLQGIYFIRITNEKHEVITRKVVKM